MCELPSMAGGNPLCTLAPAQEEFRIKFLGTSLTHGAAVPMHLYCCEVFVGSVVTEGGGTQMSLGVKRKMGAL